MVGTVDKTHKFQNSNVDIKLILSVRPSQDRGYVGTGSRGSAEPAIIRGGFSNPSIFDHSEQEFSNLAGLQDMAYYLERAL